MVEPYVTDIEQLTKDNESFREVLFTGEHAQLVVMSIRPGEDIGMETHPDVDQLLFIVDGEGTAVLDGRSFGFEKGSVICVPAGTEHDVINNSDAPVRLFTTYSPPEHAPGTVQATKPVHAAV